MSKKTDKKYFLLGLSFGKPQYKFKYNNRDFLDNPFWTIIKTPIQPKGLAAKPTQQFNLLKSQIDEVGYFEASTKTGRVKIYSPGVAYILSSNKLVVKDMVTKETKYIDGTSYLNDFMEAYKIGQEYFDERESKRVAKNLAIQYENDTNTRAWSYAKESNPLLISRKVLKEYGYYSGILSKLDEFVNENPDLFLEEKAEVNSDSSGNMDSEPEKTNFEREESPKQKLERKLRGHGFFELKKVKSLSVKGKKKLVDLAFKQEIFDNKRAGYWMYRAALFEELDFIKHLKENDYPVQDELVKNVCSWYGLKDGTSLKKALNDYTAGRKEVAKYEEKAKKDYERLY